MLSCRYDYSLKLIMLIAMILMLGLLMVMMLLMLKMADRSGSIEAAVVFGPSPKIIEKMVIPLGWF